MTIQFGWKHRKHGTNDYTVWLKTAQQNNKAQLSSQAILFFLDKLSNQSPQLSAEKKIKCW